MEPLISATEVHNIFMDSLFQEGEEISNPIIVTGITQTIGFNPPRLEKHRTEIASFLEQLPREFQEKTGGGWSFLNACMDKAGEFWTGLHSVMEELFLLGMGIGRVKCQLPRELWSVLPGGMPYFVVTGD